MDKPSAGRPTGVARPWDRAGLAVAASCGILVVTCLAVPQRLASSDTVSHPLTAWSLLEGRRGYVAPADLRLGAWSPPPQVYLLEVAEDRYVTGYGVGVAAALVPLYGFLRVLGVPPRVILSYRVGQIIAAALVLLAVALTFAVARRFTSPDAAALAAVAMALGSPALSLLSRELWQQTVLAVAFAAACWCFFRPGKEPSPVALAAAGTLVGWAVAVRPTAAVYAALWVWAAVRLVRGRAAVFAAPVAGWAGVTALYQWSVFGSPLVSGQALIPASRFGAAGVLAGNPVEGLVGILVSPGVGLLVFSPIFLVLARLAWPGNFREAGGRCPTRRVMRDLALAATAANLVTTALYREWWGGWGYGPRYSADVLVFLVLALALASQGLLSRTARPGRRVARVALGVLLGVSVFQHAAGLLVNPYGERSFNYTFDIDRHPEVLWDWRHMPSLHNLRAVAAGPPPRRPLGTPREPQETSGDGA